MPLKCIIHGAGKSKITLILLFGAVGNGAKKKKKKGRKFFLAYFFTEDEDSGRTPGSGWCTNTPKLFGGRERENPKHPFSRCLSVLKG